MTRAARSILIFGGYVALLGLLLATSPNVILGPFGFPEAREVWVRVLGVVVFVLGCLDGLGASFEPDPVIPPAPRG